MASNQYWSRYFEGFAVGLRAAIEEMGDEGEEYKVDVDLQSAVKDIGIVATIETHPSGGHTMSVDTDKIMRKVSSKLPYCITITKK